jgi:hypothetical protein
MKKIGQIMVMIGLLMLVAYVILVYIVGSVISPIGYNVLSLGGIGLALAGMVVSRLGKK